MSVEERRSHGRSPWRDAFEAVVARGSGRAPSFGITEERGPGGIVVPLLRVEIPVCDEWPSSSAAFYAALDFHALFDQRRREAQAVEEPVSASERFKAGVMANTPEPLGGRSRARVKAEAAS